MPPAVAPVPMRPTTLRAVCGSKRSLTSDQKPETSAPPKADDVEVDEQRGGAGRDEAERPPDGEQERRDSVAAAGTTRAGERRASARDRISAPTSAAIAAAPITSGSDVTSKAERKRASRTAREATWLAISRNAAIAAAAAAFWSSASLRAGVIRVAFGTARGTRLY